MNFKIIAVDFDGTLCAGRWPKIGEPNHKVIKYLKEQKRQGAKLILWTCRVGDRLAEAVEWCKKHGLEFDAVNENIPEIIERFGTDTRKIYATEYIDDSMSTRFKFPYRGRTLWRRDLLKNKLCAIVFLIMGVLSVPIEWDITFFLFTPLIAIPLFFAKENCIM